MKAKKSLGQNFLQDETILKRISDSIKTSVNLEFGFKLFKTSHFEIKSYTSLVGSKIYDDNPHLYQLGFMQKLTFGGVDEYIGTISVTRYGFAFGSFGFFCY